ncbi:ferritin-like domain-containing protein [Kordia sp.]|uniref:ferritin-like domain-containing protein n=1 Tax=Kordia sp. TaxID=1965332 RepID=UPI0025C35FC9|nr:ferritin-like domain-containing protein [Kordia sp.]MCH2194041.1 ferritin-like protein [Kordia sp.]
MNGLLFQLPKTVTKSNLKQAMQQAIEIEIATIPVYLYTYYSINRVPCQSGIETQILADMKATQKGKKNRKTDAQLQEAAQQLALDIMVFANKAGALIMSVAVEEMLHMSLSSNIKNALKPPYGGTPELVGKTPKVWPAYLPGHIPGFPINRGKLNKEQLHAFLLIESPLPFTGGKEKGNAIEYTTIGAYYDMIIKCINDELKDSDFNGDAPQLVPGKGYYAQNNIDTVYYDKDHKAQFPNDEHSGGLIHVKDKKSAVYAMDEIVEQGEGASFEINIDGKKDKIVGDHLTPTGEVVCPLFPLGSGMTNPLDYDDHEADHELSHFDKFLEVYCTIERKNHELNTFLNTKDFDFTKYFVRDLPTNPSTSDYPKAIQDVSNLTNAIYTYIFVMAEACYKTAGHKQYEIFMFGIHKSMIWLLDNLCGTMAKLNYTDSHGQTQNVAATLEDYNFDPSSSPKSQIIDLAGIAIASSSIVSQGLLDRIKDLPDVPLEAYLVENNKGIM